MISDSFTSQRFDLFLAQPCTRIRIPESKTGNKFSCSLILADRLDMLPLLVVWTPMISPSPRHSTSMNPNRSCLMRAKLFGFLDTLGFAYVIRFRGNIHVTAQDGQTRPAAAWVGKGGRARKLCGAHVGATAREPVGAVVCVHARDMKEPWCLAASDGEAPAARIVNQAERSDVLR